MESVPVQLSQGSRGGGASLSSQLAVLTQPFKLRLCRDSHDRSLRDYSSNVVLIEPLATLSAVEDFLWPRVRRPTTTTTTTPKANSNPYTAGARPPLKNGAFFTWTSCQYASCFAHLNEHMQCALCFLQSTSLSRARLQFPL